MHKSTNTLIYNKHQRYPRTVRQQNASPSQPGGIRQPHLFSLEIFACVPHRLVELLAHIQCRVVPRRRQNTNHRFNNNIDNYKNITQKNIKIEKSQPFGQLERYIVVRGACHPPPVYYIVYSTSSCI